VNGIHTVTSRVEYSIQVLCFSLSFSMVKNEFICTMLRAELGCRGLEGGGGDITTDQVIMGRGSRLSRDQYKPSWNNN
jgi:hypothetical protein